MISNTVGIKKFAGITGVTPSDPHYGAVGDGVSDDTNALQNALDNNDVVFIDKTYRITSALLFRRKGQALIGFGSGQTPRPPKIDGSSISTGAVIQATGPNLFPYMCGFSVKAQSAGVTGIAIANNYGAILERITFEGTFSRCINLGTTYAFRFSDISTAGCVVHDAGINLNTFNQGQIDNFYTSNLPPNSAIVTTGIRILAGDSWNGSLLINSPTLQGWSIGIDHQQGSGVSVNNVYSENCIVTARIGSSLAYAFSTRFSGGLIHGPLATHPQYSSDFADFYIKYAFGCSIDSISFASLSSSHNAIVLNNAVPVKLFNVYGPNHQDFTTANWIKQTTTSNGYATLQYEYYFGAAPGSFRTEKSSVDTTGQHYRIYVDNTGVLKTSAWTPSVISVPALFA